MQPDSDFRVNTMKKTSIRKAPRPVSAKARINAAAKAIEDAKVAQVASETAQGELKELTPEERAAAEAKVLADEAAAKVPPVGQ